jgi:hypothetical protein
VAWCDTGTGAATPTSRRRAKAAGSTATGKISPPSLDLLLQLQLQLQDAAGDDKSDVPGLGDLCGSVDGRRRPPSKRGRPAVGGVAG